ncbi:MAG: carbohydrate ABC transporter permease [Candidatus Wallacebacter cryptica]|jgi:ABC-type glycerol-3-phosphate transport system permease component|nr:carbohydrate ABC transporter permease [Bacillota bacterium]
MRFRLFKMDLTQIILTLFLSFLAVFMLLPIVFIFMQAFKPLSELFLYPPRFYVMNPTLDNFSQLLTSVDAAVVPVVRYLFNSVFSAAATVIVVVAFSTMVAFALSKHNFLGKNAILNMTIMALMFAPQAVIIPRYIIVQRLGIIDTYLAHILPLVAAPVSVFLFKQFVDQVPEDLLAAARIDGASEWHILFRIIYPICRPAVSTIALLTFQSAWNTMEPSIYYIENEAMRTLPFFLGTLTSGLANNVAGQGAAAAAGLLMFLPNLIFFLVMQNRVIQTMAHSGLK